MKLPQNCPHCKRQIIHSERFHWIYRTTLDYDADDPDRIEDQLMECSECHTLFRVRWKMVSFTELKEVENK